MLETFASHGSSMFWRLLRRPHAISSRFGVMAVLLKEFGRDVRTTLLEAGMSIGYFLWLSKSDNLNLTFDSIKFKEFVIDKTL
jgi:hypothetical protein